MTHNPLAPPSIDELDICALCDSSPHVVGCPHHPDYDDERVTYVSADPEDMGCARYWVEQRYAAAARDAGVRGDDALCEDLGIPGGAEARGDQEGPVEGARLRGRSPPDSET